MKCIGKLLKTLVLTALAAVFAAAMLCPLQS